MKKFRVYDVMTDETLMVIEAENVMVASFKVGKIYGEDNEDVDVEECE